MKMRLLVVVLSAAASLVMAASAQATPSASPNPLDFGNVYVNATVSSAITVTLDSGYSYGGTNLPGSTPFNYVSASCSGSSCQITASFRPTSVGPASTQWTVYECPTGGGQCSSVLVNLQGTGISSQISSPPALDFGSQTTSQPSQVAWLQVQNIGVGSLSFTGPAQITGANASDFSIPTGDDTCNGGTFATWQICWIGVRFTPAANGSRTATLQFGTNNSVLPVGTVALSGTGVPANSGPAGSPGATGSTGAPGANGTNGVDGAPGKNGQIEFVSCKPVTSKVWKRVHGKRQRVKVTRQRCTTALTSTPITFLTVIK